MLSIIKFSTIGNGTFSDLKLRLRSIKSSKRRLFYKTRDYKSERSVANVKPNNSIFPPIV